MSLYELEGVRPLSEPVLIVAFEGWVSAGSAGTATAIHLDADGDPIARFDPDQLFDYRANRPTIDFVEGVMSDIGWPEMTVRHRVYDGRDLLILRGIEPNWNWQRFGEAVADLATGWGVVEQISLGGVPWATPHTRPVSVMMTASDPSRIENSDDHPQGLLRVPGAAVSVVEHHVSAAGIPTVGFWARVPHYVGTTHYAAVVALVERVARHLDLAIPLGSLLDEAATQRRQLDELIAERPEVKAVVEQLEAITDDDQAISGEELASEIERFLRQQSSGDESLGEEPAG